MDLEEKGINPIVSFLLKYLGKNLWILPLGIAVSSWIIYFIYYREWYLISAILFSVISILYFLASIYQCIYSGISSWNKNRIQNNRERQKEENAKIMFQKKQSEKASFIWKFIAYANKNMIEAACVLLQLEQHDNNKYIRYYKRPENNFSQEQKILDSLIQVALYFKYNHEYYSTLELIKIEYQRDVVYFDIDPYFYLLLENFKNTNEWKKI